MKSQAERLAIKTSRQRSKRNGGDRCGVHRCELRPIRESLNISINAVAAATGISVSGLSVIERGADVQLSTMRKLSAFYAKKLDELWPGGSPHHG